jgi:RNase P protein component
MGYDYVIVARTRILTVKSTAVAESILKLLNSADFDDISDRK